MDGIPHNFPDFIYWGFYSLLTLSALSIMSSLKKVQVDVQKIAVCIATFEERFHGIEHRLEKLEDSRKN